MEAGKWASSQLGHSFCSLDNTRQEQPRKGTQWVCVCCYRAPNSPHPTPPHPIPFCCCLLDKYNLHIKNVTLKPSHFLYMHYSRNMYKMMLKLRDSALISFIPSFSLVPSSPADINITQTFISGFLSRLHRISQRIMGLFTTLMEW